MDQSSLQEIDLHEGIESTLTILQHKLKYSITIKRKYGEVPPIWAYGSELNQVWTNLIDNAIDAVEESTLKSTQNTPTIWIRTNCKGDSLMVEIADNGGGIPTEKISHIFEPFHTTKGVGKGTGLGLHIAYRIIVGQHHGDIQVLSQPEDTRLRVRLPLNLA
ncbi:MAG: ATP-binding protein [Coleofasciculaceae cyanobacterium]